MPDSMIKVFDRFTVSTAQGQGAMYSAWIRVPEWCQHAEMRIECHAFNNGKVEVAFETSMDQTQTFGCGQTVGGPTTINSAGLARVDITDKLAPLTLECRSGE